MLKELALLGALSNKVEISSQELAIQLHTSQQTASRYLLELDKNDMISREMGIKKQLLHITKKGKEILEDEYHQYQHIFEMPNRIHFIGTIVSGMGEGTYYITQRGYVDQFKKKLGFTPYPGTLNVKIKDIDKNKLRLLKHQPSITIHPFETNNRTFGEVKCFPSSINEIPTTLVLPARGHYSAVLEFISPSYLRDTIPVEDGDTVIIIIDLLNEKVWNNHEE
jgi:riboflavin kinase